MKRCVALGLTGCSVLNPAFEPEGEGASSTGAEADVDAGPGPVSGPVSSSGAVTGTTEHDVETSTEGEGSTSSGGEQDQPPPFCGTLVWATAGTEWVIAIHTDVWTSLEVEALPVLEGISALATTPASGDVWAFGAGLGSPVVRYSPHAQDYEEFQFESPVPNEPITRAGSTAGGKDVYFMHQWDPGLFVLERDEAEGYFGELVVSFDGSGDGVDGDLAQGEEEDQLLLILSPGEVRHVDLPTQMLSEPSPINSIAATITLSGLAHKNGRRYWAPARTEIYELEYRAGEASEATLIPTPKPLPELGDLAPAYLRDGICDQLTGALED